MIMAVQLSQRPTLMFCSHIPTDPIITAASSTTSQQPFMSSMLKSTPFATLFHTSASSDNIAAQQAISTESLASSSDSIGSLGMRMFNSLRFKTKSFMDLPSLWSSSTAFTTSSGANKDPSNQGSYSNSVSPVGSGTHTPSALLEVCFSGLFFIF